MSDFNVTQKFYKGTVTLEYDDSLHQYTISQGEDRFLVPSATGIVAMVDKSGPLMPWAAKCVVEYIGARSVFYEDSHLSVDGVDSQEKWEAFLLEAKRNFRNISETALDVGSLAHDWLEAYTQAIIDGVDYNAPLPANEAACKAITAALDWHRAHNFRPIAAEQKVYSKSLNVAGTFDWIAVIDSCDNPLCCKHKFKDKVALGDYKSSKAIYEEYRLQTAFYKHAVEEISLFESTGEPALLNHIDARVILRLGKSDGEFESLILLDEEEYNNDLDGFIGALNIYVWKKQLELTERFEKKRLKELKPKKTAKKIKVPKAPEIEVVDA